jgi:hypothetical protein
MIVSAANCDGFFENLAFCDSFILSKFPVFQGRRIRKYRGTSKAKQIALLSIMEKAKRV